MLFKKAINYLTEIKNLSQVIYLAIKNSITQLINNYHTLIKKLGNIKQTNLELAYYYYNNDFFNDAAFRFKILSYFDYKTSECYHNLMMIYFNQCKYNKLDLYLQKYLQKFSATEETTFFLNLENPNAILKTPDIILQRILKKNDNAIFYNFIEFYLNYSNEYVYIGAINKNLISNIHAVVDCNMDFEDYKVYNGIIICDTLSYYNDIDKILDWIYNSLILNGVAIICFKSVTQNSYTHVAKYQDGWHISEFINTDTREFLEKDNMRYLKYLHIFGYKLSFIIDKVHSHKLVIDKIIKISNKKLNDVVLIVRKS